MLRIHTKNMKLDENVELELIGRVMRASLQDPKAGLDILMAESASMPRSSTPNPLMH